MKKKGPLHFLGLLLVLAVFAVAAWLLVQQFRSNDLTFAKVRESLLQIPASHIALAMGLMILNYGVLVFYDYLAFRFANVPISLARVAFAALTSYSFSNNFGATVAGVPLRYRLYSSWNIPLTKIVQLLLILALTFWFGVFFIAGMLFVFDPLQIPAGQRQLITTKLINDWHVHENVVQWFQFLFFDSRPFGFLLLAMTGLYVGASLLHRGSLKIFRWTLPVPPFRLTVYQIGIASADMLVAASILYALFPAVEGGYLKLLEVYLVAVVLIVLSHVPAGWGVLEAVLMTLLGSLQLVPQAEMPKVFAAIIAFRVIYFLIPLGFGAVLFGWHEYALGKKWIPPVIGYRDGLAGGAGHQPGPNGDASAGEAQRHGPSEKK